MPCKYISTYPNPDYPAGPCGLPCDGDYCLDHQKMMTAVDELEREMQLRIRERRI
jgi:hypothetical protein